MAECLRATSALIVRDPRCAQADNDRFLDMMESYFAQPKTTKLAHSRPELHYQVGVTPEGVEMPQSALDEVVRRAWRSSPRAHPRLSVLCFQCACRSALDEAVKARMAQLPADSRPHAPSGPDCKWRFMWRVGPRPARTRYQELNASPVVPEGFPQWAAVMDGWGGKMTAAVEAVAEMLAIGFDLPQDSFTSRMHMGPHLLAPTGSDLGEHGSPGTVLAGYHADLNFLTIHGRLLFIILLVWHVCACVTWQMEWLTGGEVPAGMHEVVVDEGTVAAVQRAQQQGRSLWRVSSTVFAHIASDEILTPIGHFATSKLTSSFPPKPAGEFVEEELAAIQLKTTSGGG
ncbi:unnamed protein product [Closterium sp. Yama58-4]|nr:unnamed protein product [Closterium sp. Yama58-4]